MTARPRLTVRTLRARYAKALADHPATRGVLATLRKRHAQRGEEINLLMGALRTMRDRLNQLEKR